MIDIICYYDNHHDCLFDNFFYPTFKQNLEEKNFNLVEYKTMSKYSDSSFESKNWSDMLINRFDILKEYIIKNPSKYAIFSDVDVIFLDDFYDNIKKYLNENNIQIFYMSEELNNTKNWYINGGFFLFHCSKYIYNYFEYIQQNIKKMEIPNDQKFIHNYLQRDRKFLSGLLNDKIFATNNAHIKKIKNILPSIKVFHATCTFSALSKYQVLSSVLCLKSLKEQYKSNLWI